MRQKDQHQYNSPWNIAVPFDVDMSLSAEGIAGMLAEYKADMGLAFDENAVAQLIRDYTSGYPFLVSRICQIIDAEQLRWDKEGVLKAINKILGEGNTLFDDIVKKLDEFPELGSLFKGVLFNGERYPFNYYDKATNLAFMFNFVKQQDGAFAVACRMFEIWLYNYFISQDKQSSAFQQGYHIEEQTRDHDRMNVVVDYLGKQYVIELKIWRGKAYNERGEEQLCRYLDYFNLQTGYLLSFCFNKNKKSGLLPPIELNGRTLIEAVV